ncbi:MAG TPA: hypothetical protein P5255_11925 [Phycisphaerae bacterium]|nr:hypothetical protein [Phycisphaerae bacterium]
MRVNKREIRDRSGLKPAHRRRGWMLLASAVLMPLVILLALRAFNVPLGCPGRFVYLYSPPPVAGWRAAMVPFAAVIGAGLGLAIWLMSADDRARRVLGFVLLAGGSLALGVWTYVAPPDHAVQHAFNMQSPSQDGAFLLEAFKFEHARDYLRAFPERAGTPAELMRGTRIISNPPGMTMLAYLCRRLNEAAPPLANYLQRQFQVNDVDDPRPFLETASAGLLFTWVLTGVWLLAGVFLYRLGRLFFDPPVAGALCVCLLFSPTTLLFTPGKDTAQLLTAAVALWLWFLAWHRKSAWLAAAAGAAFTLSSVVSLVHVWLAAIALAAVFVCRPWQWRSLAGHLVAPALAGAVAAGALAYISCGLNIPATLVAVARSQAAVTRGADAMPWLWQSLGVPLFLLLAGPAFWTACLSMRRIGAEVTPRGSDHRMGLGMLLSTLLVLIATVGFTNIETPRLWIPFSIPLLLGIALLSDAVRRPERRARVFLALLVAVQIAGSALIWALLDCREAEHRLLEGRLFW